MPKRQKPDAPAKVLRTEVAHVRLTPDEYESIKAAADKDHRTLSDWMRLLCLANAVGREEPK